MKILESQDVRLIPLSVEHEAEFVRLVNIPEINSRVNKPLHNPASIRVLEKCGYQREGLLSGVPGFDDAKGILNDAAEGLKGLSPARESVWYLS